MGNLHGVMASMLDCHIVVNKFGLQSYNNVNFWMTSQSLQPSKVFNSVEKRKISYFVLARYLIQH